MLKYISFRKCIEHQKQKTNKKKKIKQKKQIYYFYSLYIGVRPILTDYRR